MANYRKTITLHKYEELGRTRIFGVLMACVYKIYIHNYIPATTTTQAPTTTGRHIYIRISVCPFD